MPIKLIRLITVFLWITFFFVGGSMLTFGYYYFLDPVAPDITMHSAEIIDRSGPSDGALDRPGVFEVARVVESRSPPKTGILHAYFEIQPPEAEPMLLDGRLITPDRTRYEIAQVEVTIAPGIHRRSRLWQVPQLLPPGDYVYKSRIEFENIMGRKVSVEFPPIPVKLSGHGWPRLPQGDLK